MARAMKDSGVAWIGKIPHGWEVRTLKSVATVNDDVLNENLAADLIIEYVDISSVSFDKGIEVTQMMEFGNAPSRARRLVKHGDIILSTVRTYLRAIAPIIQPPSNLVVSTGFAVIRPRKNIVFAFIKYSLQDDFFMGEVAARSTGVSYPAINANELMAIQVVIPPISEQCAIAEYLDQQTALIDQRLSTLEEKKSVLVELRKATIHEAVTKGLNKNAPMKDSGVAWIGEIPAHWTRLRIKDVCRAYIGATAKEARYYVGLEHIQPWLGTYQAADRAEIEASTGQLIAAGVMCFSKLRPYLAKAFVANESLFVTTELLTFIPRSAVVDADFLTRYVLTHGFITEVNDAVAGTKMPRVDWQIFATRTIFLPPLDEQLAIANHLDQQTQHIDAQLATLDEQAQVLKELRKAIIHEAVTGKIDLSGVESGEGAR